jgi:hypothetical protein
MLFKRTPDKATDTITIHVPNGAPGCTDPMQVTTTQIRAMEDKPNWTRAERGIVAAYYRAGGK